MQDVHQNIDEYNIAEERKLLIVFDDMIADMIHSKKLNLVVTEFRDRKLNISLVFITQSYFRLQKMSG